MRLTRESSEESTLPCSVSRCWTTTKERPEAGGIAGMKACRASMPAADAPMPTTGIEGLLLSSSASPSPLGLIPVIGQRSPVGCLGRRPGPILMALDHPPDHFGVFFVLARPALELAGEAVPVPAALTLRHAIGEGGPVLMGR